MRILLHDYAGHPFQVQLSRQLAARGHQVLHVFCESTVTPRGELQRKETDPPGFDVRGITLGQDVPKTNFLKRFGMERQYGRLLVKECQRWKPEVVISANTPSLAQYALAKECRRSGVRLVSWIQDIYGVAAQKVLAKKLPVVGSLAGGYFIHLDKQCAKMSDALVVITEDFADVFTGWGIDASRIHTIHNWAPIESLPVGERDNAWSRDNNLGSEPRLIYSGTLAMKHNPELLLELAKKLGERGAGKLIVISQGPGVEWLREQAPKHPEARLRLMGFQPFEEMPNVLASADVLVAILEPDAGVFSVPSKVLTYLCAKRALLLAVPQENLAAKIVSQNDAGLLSAPDDLAGFCRAGLELVDSPEAREKHGAAARAYAEENFDIERITDRFESVIGAQQPVA